MISSELLAEMYERTYDSLRSSTDGLTHEDSLIQPPFGGNCLNWVLGHVVVARANTVAMLGGTLSWPWAETRRYVPGSPPITDVADAVPWDRLRAYLDASQHDLITALASAPADKLDRPVEGRTLGSVLAEYNVHEAHHAGQIEILRAAVRAPDARQPLTAAL